MGVDREFDMTTTTKPKRLTEQELQDMKAHLEACRAEGHQNVAVDHMLLLIAEVECLWVENRMQRDVIAGMRPYTIEEVCAEDPP